MTAPTSATTSRATMRYTTMRDSTHGGGHPRYRWLPEHLAGLRPAPEHLSLTIRHHHLPGPIAVGKHQTHLTDGAETLEDSRVMCHGRRLT